MVTAERRRRSGGPDRPARTKNDAEIEERDRGIYYGRNEKKIVEQKSVSAISGKLSVGISWKSIVQVAWHTYLRWEFWRAVYKHI